jgi:glycosyltransferase involved in cell wall biosynthesis
MVAAISIAALPADHPPGLCFSAGASCGILYAGGSLSFVLIGPTFPFRGGISHHTTLLYRHMAARYRRGLFISFKRQYPAWLFPGSTDRDPSRQALQAPCERLIDPLNPWSWWRTARRIARFDPELLVIPWWVTFWALPFGTIVRLARRHSRARVVFLHHNVLPHEPRRWDPGLARFALSAGHGHVVQSASEGEALRRLLPGVRPVVSAHPIYDMFAPEMLSRAEARRRLGLPAEGPVLLFFGFVRPYKGLRYLLQALPTVRESLPDVHLLIAGEFWDDKAAYLALIERLALSASVTLLDRYVPNEEVALCFSAAEVAVLPYTHATQSGVVQLALGCNCPVITTPVGGLAGLIRDGENGLLVPPADNDALAAAIVRYLGEGLEANMRRSIQSGRHVSTWSALLDAIEAAQQTPPG